MTECLERVLINPVLEKANVEPSPTCDSTQILPPYSGRIIFPLLTVLIRSCRQVCAPAVPILAAMVGSDGTVVKTAVRFIRETWTRETLSNDPEPTSASNETSAVQLMEYDGRRILFTADVGPAGLTEAARYAHSLGRLGNLKWVQLPLPKIWRK